MKRILIAASLLALAFGGVAHAMSTVTVPAMPAPGNTFNPAPPSAAYGIMRYPDGPDSVNNPYANGAGIAAPYGNPYLYGTPNGQTGPGQRFLNVDPFDPNSVMNNFDRGTYANPFQYDPIYNPYGQGSSPYAPGGGANVPMGRGVPYGR